MDRSGGLTSALPCGWPNRPGRAWGGPAGLPRAEGTRW